MLTQYTKEIKNSEYDRLTDILYVHFDNDRGDSYGDEYENGVEVFKDCATNQITGFEVYNLNRHIQLRQAQLSKMGFDYDLKELCKR